MFSNNIFENQKKKITQKVCDFLNISCNIFSASDLDSIRALFNEKEKELSLAVAKVEELTRQLEELRRGRSTRDQTPASALELDKLRRELMVHKNYVILLRIPFRLQLP